MLSHLNSSLLISEYWLISPALLWSCTGPRSTTRAVVAIQEVPSPHLKGAGVLEVRGRSGLTNWARLADTVHLLPCQRLIQQIPIPNQISKKTLTERQHLLTIYVNEKYQEVAVVKYSIFRRKKILEFFQKFGLWVRLKFQIFQSFYKCLFCSLHDSIK